MKCNLIILSQDDELLFFKTCSYFPRNMSLRAGKLWLEDNFFIKYGGCKWNWICQGDGWQAHSMKFYWMIKGGTVAKYSSCPLAMPIPVQPYAAEHTALHRQFSQHRIGWKWCHIAHLPMTDCSPWYSLPPHIS